MKLYDRIYKPTNEVMSLNLVILYYYLESLSLTYPKLINWEKIEPHDIPTFDTNRDISIYLHVVEPSPKLESSRK